MGSGRLQKKGERLFLPLNEEAHSFLCPGGPLAGVHRALTTAPALCQALRTRDRDRIERLGTPASSALLSSPSADKETGGGGRWEVTPLHPRGLAGKRALGRLESLCLLCPQGTRPSCRCRSGSSHQGILWGKQRSQRSRMKKALPTPSLGDSQGGVSRRPGRTMAGGWGSPGG